MVQRACCCIATSPGVLRVGGVRCDGGERRLLALVRAGRNAAVRVMKLGPQSTPDDVQRVRHGGVSTQRRPLAADGLGGRRRPPLVAGQPHVTLRIKKIAERRTIWGAAAPRGPNSPRRAAAAKRIFQGAQEGKSQRPGGFLGPSCGCSASIGRAFCAAQNAAIRTARGSKLTDLLLSDPNFTCASTAAAGAAARRRAPRPASTAKTQPHYGSLFFGGWPARAAERDRVGGGGPAL